MFPWMPVDEFKAKPTVEAASISAVARSPRGFL
jgi:hypothetical protein